MRFTIMESKRAGTCNECFGEIVVGELIEWNRSFGAKHYRNPNCVPQLATDEQLKAYTKALTDAIKAWDRKGSFRPLSYGEWLDSVNKRS